MSVVILQHDNGPFAARNSDYAGTGYAELILIGGSKGGFGMLFGML
jgi:hypothetical protein